MIADAKLRYGKVKFQVCNAENFRFKNKFDSIFSNATLHWIKNYKSVIKCMYKNLKFNGKIVLEFGGKNNVKTIVDQLRSSLKKRGYLNQSKLELWYFPSAEEYSKELELVGFKVVLAESFNRKTELTNQKDGIKDWISMFAKSFFKDVDLTHIEEIKTEVQESIKEKYFTNGKWYADYKRIRFIAIKNIY
jgi:trans-aconitate methyltransferase